MIWTKNHTIITVTIIGFILLCSILYIVLRKKDNKVSTTQNNNGAITYPCLVLLHREHCGPCRTMMNDWKEAKQELLSRNINVYDFESNDSGFSHFQNIIGTPTVRWYYSENNYKDYKGNRTKDSFIHFVEENK